MTPFRVLMIDDNSSDAYVIERIIRRLPNTPEFKWMEDPVEALDHLCTVTPNFYSIILLDIKMPRLRGTELLAELSNRSLLSPLARKIIVYSSSDMPIDQEQVLQYPGVRYKTKPSGYLDAKLWLRGLILDPATKPINR